MRLIEYCDVMGVGSRYEGGGERGRRIRSGDVGGMAVRVWRAALGEKRNLTFICFFKNSLPKLPFSPLIKK